MIAALYVETGGVYYGLPDVDPCVDQRWYGHEANKPTWLYYVGPNPPTLRPIRTCSRVAERLVSPPCLRRV